MIEEKSTQKKLVSIIVNTDNILATSSNYEAK